ncbi:Core-2/I-branching beta-1,6-N-acetylglucosaminyltransferase family protein [Hibiscus syriacus]|uniref:Core-2/I-branching beta-1,6-N-acetylglucosaminyltransferase family protein n=1 Tax=Hibiscus syriacus TaxID=106335 RepID=A0A6A2WS24_HIBSY|nr:Core-2/I-branching beta-1,6-N-acetylglucosaminyltransferase family protein [Hibiscus syriacus]
MRSVGSSARVGHVRMTKFLEPPNAMHDMDDKELLWRASMSPRIAECSSKGTKGCTRSMCTPIRPSTHRSLMARCSTAEEFPARKLNGGKVNMIEAERRLVANALRDFSNQRFVLLLESCVPLFNFSTVYSYLINSSHTFVESYDLPGPVGRY